MYISQLLLFAVASVATVLLFIPSGRLHLRIALYLFAALLSLFAVFIALDSAVRSSVPVEPLIEAVPYAISLISMFVAGFLTAMNTKFLKSEKGRLAADKITRVISAVPIPLYLYLYAM